MFSVEYVIVKPDGSPRIVDKVYSQARSVADVNILAMAKFEMMRRKHLETPPNGYQILDDQGDVVLRSWDSA